MINNHNTVVCGTVRNIFGFDVSLHVSKTLTRDHEISSVCVFYLMNSVHLLAKFSFESLGA